MKQMNSDLPKPQPLPQTPSAVMDAVNALAAGASGASSVSALLNTECRGACVLLVDDSDVVRDVSRAVLEDAGVVVEEAHDGAMAVRLLQAHPARYALVFMDVQMPVLDGLAATRMIQADLGTRMPPIVALTANVSEQEKSRCLAAGMRDHVSKPVDPHQLVAVLNRWLAPLGGTPQSTPAAPAVAMADRAVPPSLPDVPGFDLQAGLHCVGGNVQRLRSLLARFGARYAGVVAELQQLIAFENYHNYTEARRLAHTLKGAAATLGGTRIADAAQRVEHALQQRCEATGNAGPLAEPTELTELDTALQQALPALQALYATNVMGEPLPVSAAFNAAAAATIPQSEAAAFEALRQLLAGNCYAARLAFTALRDRLGASDAAWQAAGVAVDALDFQQALAQLDARYPPQQGNAT